MAVTATPAQLDPQQTRTAEDGDELITMTEIRAKFKLGRTAGYELVRRPDFPARIVISPRCHRWLRGEVDAFSETLREHPVPGQIPARPRVQPSGLMAPQRRLTGQQHPVRARKESR